MVKDGREWLNLGANVTAPPPWSLSLTVSLGFMAMGIAAFASSGPVGPRHPLNLSSLSERNMELRRKKIKTEKCKGPSPPENGVGFSTCG